MMRLSTLALLMCCMLLACDDKDESTPNAGPVAGTGGSAGEAGAGGEAGTTGEACMNAEVLETCAQSEAVVDCDANVFTCSDDGPACYKDLDCAGTGGTCITPSVCTYLLADCVEEAGYPEVAACERAFDACLEELGASAEEECGGRRAECMNRLPNCE